MKLIFTALVLGLLAIAAPDSDAQETIALAPLRERLRTVEVSINGERGVFLFDSAAGVSMVSPQFAARIGCTPRGRLVGFRMMGDRLDVPRCDGLTITVGHVNTPPLDIGVLDMTPFLAAGQRPQDGVLGLDALAGRLVTLDMGHNALVLETPESLNVRIIGATEAPARIGREVQGAALAVHVGVQTPNDGLAWFELDTGNGGTVLVSKHIAPQFGLDPEAQGPQRAHFQLTPGVEVESDRAFTPDMILDGNLGMPFLMRHVVTIDLAAGRVWIKPNAQASSSTSQ